MPRASGAVNASRPAALAWSRIFRTAFLLFGMCFLYDFLQAQLSDLSAPESQFLEHHIRMFSEQRRTGDMRRTVAHFYGVAHGKILAALGMIHLDDGTALAQGRFMRQLLH